MLTWSLVQEVNLLGTSSSTLTCGVVIQRCKHIWTNLHHSNHWFIELHDLVQTLFLLLFHLGFLRLLFNIGLTLMCTCCMRTSWCWRHLHRSDRWCHRCTLTHIWLHVQFKFHSRKKTSTTSSSKTDNNHTVRTGTARRKASMEEGLRFDHPLQWLHGLYH